MQKGRKQRCCTSERKKRYVRKEAGTQYIKWLLSTSVKRRKKMRGKKVRFFLTKKKLYFSFINNRKIFKRQTNDLILIKFSVFIYQQGKINWKLYPKWIYLQGNGIYIVVLVVVIIIIIKKNIFKMFFTNLYSKDYFMYIWRRDKLKWHSTVDSYTWTQCQLMVDWDRWQERLLADKGVNDLCMIIIGEKMYF